GLALDLARETGNTESTAYALLNRAEVYRDQRRFQDALADVRASLEIYEKNQTQLEMAGALTTIAKLQLDLGNEPAALDAARRAEDLSRAIPVPDILWEALGAKGRAYQRLNRPAEARAAYTEGIEVVGRLRQQLAGGEQQGQDFLRNKMNLFHGLLAL